jgi:hypothetical protein
LSHSNNALVVFEIGSPFMPWPVCTTVLFVLPPRTWDDDTCHQTQPLVEMRISRLFCPGWPWTETLLVSVSQEARIMDLNYHARLNVVFWYMYILWNDEISLVSISIASNTSVSCGKNS